MIDNKHGRLSFCDSYLTTTMCANPGISVFIDDVFPLEFKAKTKSSSSTLDHLLRTVFNFILCWFDELLMLSARGYYIYSSEAYDLNNRMTCIHKQRPMLAAASHMPKIFVSTIIIHSFTLQKYVRVESKCFFYL